MTTTHTTTPRSATVPVDLPAGLYPARCSALIDLGTHEETPPRGARTLLSASGKPPSTIANAADRSLQPPQTVPQARSRRLILLTFTVFLHDGSTIRQSRQFSLSTNTRSGLFKFLTPWLGATWHKAGKIRPTHITEQPCLLNLQHSETTNPATGQPWLNIVSASPLLAGMTVPDLRWPAKIFSLRAPDRAIFLRLPAWMTRRIRSSQEWQQLTQATGSTSRKPQPSHV